MNISDILNEQKRSGKEAENEFIKLSGGASFVKKQHRNASLHLEASVKTKESIKAASQSKIIKILEQEYGKGIKVSNDISMSVQNFNPVKWDMLSLKDISVWFPAINKDSIIEVKDTSKTNGRFIFAEVFKISTRKKANKINNLNAKKIFNEVVTEINKKIHIFIKDELKDIAKDKYGNQLDRWFLASKEKDIQDIKSWNIKKINKDEFFRDVSTKIVNSYFKDGELTGIKRIEVFFKEPPLEEEVTALREIIIEFKVSFDISYFRYNKVINFPVKTEKNSMIRLAADVNLTDFTKELLNG